MHFLKASIFSICTVAIIDVGLGLDSRQPGGQTSSQSAEKPKGVETQSKIVYGEAADVRKYPFMVSLQPSSHEGHTCGGVLIAKDVVLTAAHCIHQGQALSKPDPTPRAIIGGYKLAAEDLGEERRVCRAHVHQFYDGEPELGHDIAMLFLNKESSKDPIKELDSSSIHDSLDGLLLDAIGFGRISEGGPDAEVLQEAKNLEYVNNEICSVIHKQPSGFISRTMLCAVPTVSDTCDGDSGGPLLRAVDGILMGLTSFGGRGCGGSGPPGVYTRISEFVRWIHSRGSPHDEIHYSDHYECDQFKHGDYPPVLPDGMDILENLKRGRKEAAVEVITTILNAESRDHFLVLAAKEALAQCVADAFMAAFSKATNGSENASLLSKIEAMLAAPPPSECNGSPEGPNEEPESPFGDPVHLFEEPISPFEEPISPFEELIIPFVEPISPFEEPMSPFVEPISPFEEPMSPFEEPMSPFEDSINPFEEPQSPSEELGSPIGEDSMLDLPSATVVLAKVERDKAGATADIAVLARSGEEGKEILHEILQSAQEQGLIVELGSILVTAASTAEDVETTLHPFAEAILVDVAIEGLARAIILKSHDEAVALLFNIGNKTVHFPSLSTRQHIVLAATQQAQSTSKSKADNLFIVRVLLDACGSMENQDVCKPAVDYIAEIQEHPGG